jgi:bifunctional enzyme CysN/CysC
VAGSRKPARSRRIVTMDGDLPQAIAGRGGDAGARSRGRHLARRRAGSPGETPDYSNQFQARLVWMNDEPAIPGRSYLLKLGAQQVPATITALKFRTNVNTLEESAAKTLELNEVGTVTIATDKPIAFDSLRDNAPTGSFILIDRISNATLGAGVIDFGLRRAQNLSYQSFDVNRQVRAELKGQRPRSSGSPASPARASRRSPTSSRSASPPKGGTPTSSTATMSGTASTRTSASPTRRGSRTSAGSPKSRG